MKVNESRMVEFKIQNNVSLRFKIYIFCFILLYFYFCYELSVLIANFSAWKNENSRMNKREIYRYLYGKY